MRKVFLFSSFCYKTQRSSAGSRGQHGKEIRLQNHLPVPAGRAHTICSPGSAPRVINPCPSICHLRSLLNTSLIQHKLKKRSISVLLKKETRSLCSKGCSPLARAWLLILLLNLVRSNESVSNPEFLQIWIRVRHLPWFLFYCPACTGREQLPSCFWVCSFWDIPLQWFLLWEWLSYIKTMSLQGFQNLTIGKRIHMKLLKENSSWKDLGKDFKCCQAEFCAWNTWAGGPTASRCLARDRGKCRFHLQQ